MMSLWKRKPVFQSKGNLVKIIHVQDCFHFPRWLSTWYGIGNLKSMPFFNIKYCGFWKVEMLAMQESNLIFPLHIKLNDARKIEMACAAVSLFWFDTFYLYHETWRQFFMAGLMLFILYSERGVISCTLVKILFFCYHSMSLFSCKIGVHDLLSIILGMHCIDQPW